MLSEYLDQSVPAHLPMTWQLVDYKRAGHSHAPWLSTIADADVRTAGLFAKHVVRQPPWCDREFWGNASIFAWAYDGEDIMRMSEDPASVWAAHDIAFHWDKLCHPASDV